MKINIILFMIILAACIFRLAAIGWGLPFRFCDDETNYIEIALRIGIGKFEPEQLCHGTLFPEILFFVYGLYFVIGKVTGIFSSPNSFILTYLRNPSSFVVLARLVVIGFSMSTIYLTYLIGKKLFSEKTGILAGLLLSLSTVHYMMSVSGLADMVAVFFLLLSFYILLKYYYEDSTRAVRYFCLSGFILGLALAGKLLMLPGVVFYIVIYVFKEKAYPKFVSKRLVLGLFLVFLGFFIAEPYPFLNPVAALANLNRLQGNYMVKVKLTPPLYAYLFDWLPNCLGKISIFVLYLSLIYFLFKRSVKVMFILIFPVFHFLGFQAIQATSFAFHLLSSLPFLCLTISVFLYDASRYFRKWGNMFVFSLSLLCVFNPALDSLRYCNVVTSRDTRAEAKEWIEENIQPGKGIMLEGVLGNNPVLVPVPEENLESLEDSLKWVIARGGSGRFQKLLIDNYDDIKKTYRLYKFERFKEADVLLNTGADYVITSGYFDLDLSDLDGTRGKPFYDERKKVYAAIGKNYILIKKFEPFPKLRLFYPFFFTADFHALRKIDIFGDWTTLGPGPELMIYKRKEF